ncbi:MAG TPA: BlaI/MecI/CopY family transcriptional regulator [Clostridia bacterium]|nr:BlaI/MecI/CopY family transcriptional regulator [Clostridia bacterium]
MKRLPDAEFDVMKEVWQLTPPITSGMLLDSLVGEKGKEWKLQTLHTLLARLVDRGFLRFEKKGKEKKFYPLIERDEYLKFETRSFVRQYHEGSLLNLVNAAYQGEKLSDADIDELVKWAAEQRRDKT